MPANRSLPSHPDLEQQRTLARELLRAFRAGDAEARDRVRAQLPDKPRITLADAQFVLAREYGLSSWADLRKHIEAARQAAGAGAGGVPPELAERLRLVLRANDAAGLRELLQAHGQLRALLNEPLFDYDSPALVHVALRRLQEGVARGADAGERGREDAGLVDVLLSFGADPNRRSSWWAGAFHPLHVASDAATERLLRAGAVPDACAAAHIDRPDLLDRLLAEDPGRVHERGGDGQTPLHFAHSQAVVDLLLAHGADIDARDVDHRATPAQWMLDRWRGAGRFELARYLVQRGAETDIFLAAALGLTERVRTMLTADPSLLDLRTNHGPYGQQPPSSFHIYTWTIGGDLSPMQVAAQFEQRDTLEVMRGLAEPRQRLVAALDAGDTAAAHALLAAHPGMLDTLSDADRQVLVIKAEAERDAQIARGEGDAKAAEIYAAAYSKNPEFYAFYRSLNAYRESFKSGDFMVLDPKSDFLRYFNEGESKAK